MKKFIIDHPIWFAIGMSLFDLVLGIVIFIIGDMIGLSEGALELVALLVGSAVPLFLIGWLGWWRDAGFVRTTQNVPVLAIPLIVALFTLVWFGTVTLESGLAVRLTVAFLLTGLAEESLSRGLLLRALLPLGKWQAVLIPSVLFGLGHITQFLFLGMPFGVNLIQIVNATLTGFMWGTVRLRVNNIWPLIIIHMLGDLFSSLTGVFGIPGAIGLGGVPATFWFIRWGVLLIAGIYLLGKSLLQPPSTVKLSAKGLSIMGWWMSMWSPTAPIAHLWRQTKQDHGIPHLLTVQFQPGNG